jgi:transcriptional regulator with XRE-family HTH domain
LSIGAALAQARGQGGLTVAQVSQRTRIRETIIRDIERDDYSSCGGDFYARGHIRAIARVVGLDATPLIAQYDAARTPPEPPPAQEHERTEPAPGRERWDTLSVSWQRPREVPAAQEASYHPGGITAAEAFRPAMPLSIGARRRRPGWTLALAVVLLAAIAFLGYHLASGSGNAKPSAGASHPPVRRAHKPAKADTGTSPSPSASAAAVALTPAGAVAFGPGGTGQGDNPGMASLAIDGNGSAGWQTDWYASPTFAGLQSGTGLLLDMGKSVTVSSAELTLASSPGATIQLRVGDTPVLADLQPVAQATNASGTLQLRPASPTSARYVLIWITKLPPDSSGTYQETVSDIKIAGTS